MKRHNSSSNPVVVRVRGIPRTDVSSAEAVVHQAIRQKAGWDCSGYSISIVPACDQAEELTALVDFQDGLPAYLAPLKKEPPESYDVMVDDEELSFDYHFNGFTQLYNVLNEKDIKADVIAICGIAGHAYGSWQGRAGNRRMWLRHFLPKDLPSCRVMTYGYNSKLSRPGFATAEDYADEFLEDLKRIRTGQAQERPIIFIAHSFGGLILAQSLVKAVHTRESSHESIASLFPATYGILFFAVPHRGIDVEDMMRRMIAEKNPKVELLSSIDHNSPELRTHLKAFKSILNNRPVVSFYETEQSRRMQRTDTDAWKRCGEYYTSLKRDDAILDLPEHMETRIPLHRDHSAMIKFDNRYDEGYSKVRFELQEFMRAARQVVSQRFLPKPPRSSLLPTQSTPNLSIIHGDADKFKHLPSREKIPSEMTAGPSESTTEQANAQDPGVLMIESSEQPTDQTSDQSAIEELRKKDDKAFRLYAQGHHAESEATLREMLPGHQKTLGPYHQVTLDVLYNLALQLYYQQKYEEAIVALLDVLEGQRKALGDYHVDTLCTIHLISQCYRDCQMWTEAETMSRQGAVAHEKKFGPNYHHTLDMMQILAKSYLAQRKYEEAEATYWEVLTRQENSNSIGPYHADTLQTARQLEKIYEELGKRTEARAMCRRQVKGQAKSLGIMNDTTTDTAGRYVVLSLKDGARKGWAEARKFYKEHVE